MPKKSAGILLYKFKDKQVQIFLLHPGGPFFKNKDNGVWSIPKGEFQDDEDPLAAAKREFTEETGHTIDGKFVALQPIKIKSGKIISAWAVEGQIAADRVNSNLFEMEWPPRSGKMTSFPEIDKGEWFNLDEARIKITPGQLPLIDQLIALLFK
jgi:predicted NUDIX family NTP pyrophosphohydrolase